MPIWDIVQKTEKEIVQDFFREDEKLSEDCKVCGSVYLKGERELCDATYKGVHSSPNEQLLLTKIQRIDLF